MTRKQWANTIATLILFGVAFVMLFTAWSDLAPFVCLGALLGHFVSSRLP